MAVDSGRGARQRAWIVITILITIGVGSIVAHINLRKDYTIANALFDLGYSCLTAAIFFVIINKAIGGYEARQQKRFDLVNRLRGDEGSTSLMLSQLARGANISGLNLSDSSTNFSLELEDKRLTSCQLDRCNLDSSSFNKCKFKDVSMKDSSLRLAVIETCSFDSVKFDGTDLTGVLFVNCNFGPECSFANCMLSDVRFNNCNFTEATLRSMQAYNASFNSCSGINAACVMFLSDQGAMINGTSKEIRK